MKNHPALSKQMATGVCAAVVLTLVLGFAPRILKAASSKPDLIGNLGCAQTAPSCTPTPTPTATPE